MRLTAKQLTAIKAAKTRVTTAASALAGLRPLPSEQEATSRAEPGAPNLRFVIETKGPAKLADVRRVVGRVLGSSGVLSSGVSWIGRRLTVSAGARQALRVSSAFDVRFMFPGADPSDQRFKLANFVVVTLPVDPLDAKKKLGGRTGSLYDLAYAIKDAGNYVRVDPEIPAKPWMRSNVPIPPPPPSVPPGQEAPAGETW